MSTFDNWDNTGRTYHLDKSGIILGMNFSARCKFDLPGNDIIGKTLFDILPKGAAEYRMRLLEEIISTGKAMDIIDTSEGHKKHSRIVPMFDNSGEVSQVIVFVSDLQRPKRDVLWERLLYAWNRAKPVTKYATLVGLWSVGRVTSKYFYFKWFSVALVSILISFLIEHNAVILFNGMIAGGSLALIICGTILRYFIR